MSDEREVARETVAQETPEPLPAADPATAPDTESSIPEGEQDPRTPAAVPLLRVVPVCLVAWLVPGLGHVALGRLARGLGLGAVVLALFVGGIALDGKVYRPVRGEPLTYLASAGAAGVGLPFAVAHLSGAAVGEVASPYYDYGNTFTLVAGLLNLLIVIDAYDVALRRR